jgi:hypothetical protein
MNSNDSGVVHVAATSGDVPDDGHHGILEPGVVDRCPEEGQRVHLADPVVDDLGVVVFPARLVLLGAPVVIDGEQDDARPLGSVAEPDRRATAVRADFEHRHARQRRTGGDRCVPQRITLVGGHEALGGERQSSALGRHHVSQWMIESGSGRSARLKSVPTV